MLVTQQLDGNGKKKIITEKEKGKGKGWWLTGHEELRVRMEVDISLQAVGVGEPLKKFRMGLHLWGVACFRSTVRLIARISRRALAFPFVGPVAIDISASTFAVLVRLAILAPHPIVGLGIDKAWELLLGIRQVGR